MGRPSKPLDPSSSQEARLGAAIRHRREQRGITQEQLAEAIGFSRPHLALVELGRAHASEELVRRCDEAKSIPAVAPAVRARLSASSSIRRPASLIRPLALVERAFAPRRSHSISRRTVLASDS